MLEWFGKWLRAYAEKDGRGYPDWAIRYVPVANRLRRRDLVSARILEVGANEAGLARLAQVRTFVVDAATANLVAARSNPGVLPVAADVSALPFNDRSFDVCVCLDTLEHIPGQARERAVVEIARVLSLGGTAVAAFPAGDAAASAEESIQREYRVLTGRTLQWLDEHRNVGLPDPGDIASQFAALLRKTHRVSHESNATLWVWKWMWRVLLCGWPGRGNALFQAVLRLFTPLLCRIHFGRCYRAIIWVEPYGG